MGLDTSHGCWNGGYGRFNSFRRNIAESIGFNLREMEGFGGSISFETMDHPVKPLLDHSDCDGELTPIECSSVANGINLILLSEKALEFHDEFTNQLIRFRDGCLKAAINNECVEFA